MNLPFDLRPPKASDVPFILSTWLKSQRRQGDRALMTNTVYFDGESNRIKRIITHPACQTWIICNPEDEEQIYGYVVSEYIGPVFTIHFAYIKRTYRRLGLMKESLSLIYRDFLKEEIAITRISETIISLRDKFKLKFNPYMEEIER